MVACIVLCVLRFTGFVTIKEGKSTVDSQPDSMQPILEKQQSLGEGSKTLSWHDALLKGLLNMGFDANPAEQVRFYIFTSSCWFLRYYALL